ncbi:aminomethyl-transferring glycine dehydrogenase subunit GcvPA [candidate division KSB1 bacterium]|nr:MAG: aminomethyl-transferring glycine dehydrogenase subunit GcvPA [candidate division KSB1 bacterium]
MPFIPHTEIEQGEMLNTIGVENFEQLLEPIPISARLPGTLKLPKPLSELETFQLVRQLSQNNISVNDYICFLGGGAYDHYIPAAVDHILARPEFYTAYTPYQPEVSQGTLQAIYEYQSLICNLTGMDVTNASMYDGGSALAEAALLAHRVKNRQQIAVSMGVNPFYRQIIRTYCKGQNIQIDEIPIDTTGGTNLTHLKQIVSDQTAAVILQHPNFFGCLEEVFEIEKMIHQVGALYITCVDPISLGLLTPPGEYNADIVIGEGQVLGNALAFGGPYLGIFSTKREFIRKIPGRLIGQTVDSKGRRGFVMTLQTREQHIRREKATSNICTNQTLNALAATVYLSLLGKEGLREVANQCLQKSHYLAEGLQSIPGCKLKFSRPFFKEFAIEITIPAKSFLETLKSERILAGIDLQKFNLELENTILIAVTEKRSQQEMDTYLQVASQIFQK